jgi:hypothetical protein
MRLGESFKRYWQTKSMNLISEYPIAAEGVTIFIMQDIYLNQTVSKQVNETKAYTDQYNLQGLQNYERVKIQLNSQNFNGSLQLINLNTGQVIAETSKFGNAQDLSISFTALPNTKYALQVTSEAPSSTSSYLLKTESTGMTTANDVMPSIASSTQISNNGASGTISTNTTGTATASTNTTPTPNTPTTGTTTGTNPTVTTPTPNTPTTGTTTGTNPTVTTPTPNTPTTGTTTGTSTTGTTPITPTGTTTTANTSTVTNPNGTTTTSAVTVTTANTGTIALGENNILNIQDGNVSIQFTPGNSSAKFRNEMGVFVVDDAQGRINGILPGEAGYLAAAMNRAQVISSNGDEKSIGDTSRQIVFSSGTRLGCYLVQNGTTAEIKADLAAGKTARHPVFFQSGNQDGEHLKLTANGSSYNFAWEDTLGGGDRDFNDVLINATATNTPLSKGAALQSQQPVIDLRDITGLQTTGITVSGDAAFDNFIGFYTVDDPTGKIGNLTPDSLGYAQAALKRSVASYSKSAGLVGTDLTGGTILAPYLIAKGTVQSFLANNPNNQVSGNLPVAYFGYVGANPDRISHLRVLGDNKFGFEDVFGGGDRDFNDAIVQVQFIT